jgi:hypothetical protein
VKPFRFIDSMQAWVQKNAEPTQVCCCLSTGHGQTVCLALWICTVDLGPKRRWRLEWLRLNLHQALPFE